MFLTKRKTQTQTHTKIDIEYHLTEHTHIYRASHFNNFDNLISSFKNRQNKKK